MGSPQSSTIRKAYKFRLYPTVAQQQILARRFGACRWVWNHFLAERKAIYQLTGKTMNYNACARSFTDLKRQSALAWLQEGYVVSYQQALRDQDKAYGHFFRRVKNGEKPGFPRFKSRNARQAMRFVLRTGCKLSIQDKRIRVPKVGHIRMVQHRRIEGVPKNMTVSRTKSGRYFVSIQCELEMELPEPSGAAVGIDLGLSAFATLSTGEQIAAPRHYRREERRLRLLQRRVSRKRKGSSNRRRAVMRVTKLHERIANRRVDYLHKLSHALTKRHGHIGIEDLNLKGMQQGLNLAKSVSDAGVGEFVRQLGYKGRWYGCEVVKVDRWFPSSKLCSECGEKNDTLTLSDRRWVCEGCGVIHERDENAAANILNESLKISTARTVGIDAHGDMSRRSKATQPGNLNLMFGREVRG